MSSTAETRVVFLDGLRAIAAVAVVLQHYLEVAAHEPFAWFLQLAPGVFGVVLFFCISGYVIPFSAKYGMQPMQFMVRRTFRIMPLFLCVLMVVIGLGALGIAPFAERIESLGTLDYVANAMLINEYVAAPAVLGVAWTLSVEFVWYALFAVFFLRFGHGKAFEASILFFAGMVGLALVSILADQRVPLGRVGMIGAALLGYVFCCWHQGWMTGQRAAMAGLAFGAATVFCQWVSFGYFDHPQITLFSGMTGWLGALGIFALVAGVSGLRAHPVWENEGLQKVGQLSFSIYLWHMPFFLLLGNVTQGVAQCVGAAIFTLVLSEISHRCVELPGNKIAKRWIWRARIA